MKSLLTLSIIAVAAVVAVACTGKKTEETSAKKEKSLVLYYSQMGTTKIVAEELQRLTGADIECIEVENPYDGTYDETIARVKQEREEQTLPVLKPLKVNLTDYDIIYLGYPIWFGTFAPPVIALLETEKFEGKKIVPFCSFGSGGLEATEQTLKTSLPQAEVTAGYGVRTARIKKMPAELDRFLKENGLIEGTVEALPEFSEQQPVGEAEKNLFDLACGNYQFPLGTPVTFAKREIQNGTEYKFGVDNKSTIYVVDQLVEGDMKVVEFTKVVR